MKKLSLQLVEAANWESLAIGRYGGGGWAPEYSHADCVTSKGDLVGARNDVLNGVPAGVQIRQQGYEKWIHCDRYSKDVPDEVAAAWDAAVYAGIGAHYDQDAIWSFALGVQLHTIGDFICSAYATSRLQLVGIVPKDLAIPPQGYSPNAVAFGLAYLGFTCTRLQPT